MITLEEYQQLLENKYNEDLSKLTTFFNTNEDTIKQKIAEENNININNLQIYYGCRFFIPLVMNIVTKENNVLKLKLVKNEKTVGLVSGNTLEQEWELTKKELFAYTGERELSLNIDLIHYQTYGAPNKEDHHGGKEYVPTYITFNIFINFIKYFYNYIFSYYDNRISKDERYFLLNQAKENAWTTPTFEKIDIIPFHFFAIKDIANDELIIKYFYKKTYYDSYFNYSAEDLIFNITRDFNLT